jgi:hypothetical protein
MIGIIIVDKFSRNVMRLLLEDSHEGSRILLRSLGGVAIAGCFGLTGCHSDSIFFGFFLNTRLVSFYILIPSATMGAEC